MQLIGEEEISVPRLGGIHGFIKSHFRVGEQRALGFRNLANDGVISPVGLLVGVVDVRRGPFSKKRSHHSSGVARTNITKLYSLRNVPVHLLDQVGSYAPLRTTASSHWRYGVTNAGEAFGIPGDQLWRWGAFCLRASCHGEETGTAPLRAQQFSTPSCRRLQLQR
jgi:hypothetical protein